MKLDIFINELIKWNKIHKITNYTTKESIKKTNRRLFISITIYKRYKKCN